ncbi:MAG: 30S ribosomal protein S6 [Lachnospiraceae bacterium]|nr:30S ribosomal protein S6 [Lachnospiraceae bacterium]
MNKYELAVAVNGQLESDAKNAVLEKVRALITRFGGTIKSEDDWGKRRFAYEVHKVKEGYYVFIKFQAEPEAIAEIEHRIRIIENVYRYLIVSDEKELSVKHEEEKSESAEASYDAPRKTEATEAEAAPAAADDAAGESEAQSEEAADTTAE